MGKLDGQIVNINSQKDSGSIAPEGGGKEISFEQPYGADLGLDKKVNVAYNQIQNGKSNLAVSVIPQGTRQEKGTITQVNNDNQTGNLEKGTSKLPFDQPYLKQLGIGKGSSVYFSTTSDGQTAIALSLA